MGARKQTEEKGSISGCAGKGGVELGHKHRIFPHKAWLTKASLGEGKQKGVRKKKTGGKTSGN